MCIQQDKLSIGTKPLKNKERERERERERENERYRQTDKLTNS